MRDRQNLLATLDLAEQRIERGDCLRVAAGSSAAAKVI
jgi:hypothetical protein